MTSKGVSLLKFVGTVSLGLLTGLSYSLSTVTVPAILTLPTASSASQAFQDLFTKATHQLRILTGVSTTALLLAFCFSPRSQRHPYLLYTSILALTSGLAEQITPYVLKPSETSAQASAARQQARRDRQAARAARAARMEASYEVLGDSHSEGASASGEEIEDEQLNGEELRGEVEGFLKTQLVQTAIASVGFLMAVVGIWGDGAVQVFQSETIVFEV